MFFLTLTLMDSEKFWFNSKFNFDLGCLCSSRYISSNFDCDLMLLFISKRGKVVTLSNKKENRSKYFYCSQFNSLSRNCFANSINPGVYFHFRECQNA